MPHSNRKHRNTVPAQKRIEVTDNDGWTHVASGSNVRRVMRTAKLPVNSPVGGNQGEEAGPVLSPAEAPARLTFEELEAQYRGYKERWVASETWQTLREHLEQRIRNQGEEEVVYGEPGGFIDGIACIGLGSPSGFLRDGWVDRRTVSMYQLAALDTIRDTCNNVTNTSLPLNVPTYAQDPVFNNLDRALFRSLDISVVEHPTAFHRITSKTLLFCPGAERQHLDMMLPSNPKLVLGGPLENTESSIIQDYVDKTDSRVLVPFSAQEHAFWNMRLYFRPPLAASSS